jgi:hypothetical protein
MEFIHLDTILYWAGPFVKGIAFGLGQYICFRFFGPTVLRFFKPALKNEASVPIEENSSNKYSLRRY